MHGQMLEALKCCYSTVNLWVKVGGKLGRAFASLQGVKQGCPLSPPLYGFYGESYHDYVEAKDRNFPPHMCVDAAPSVNGRRVDMEMYSDDRTLFALSHERLMRLLGALTEWCEAFVHVGEH